MWEAVSMKSKVQWRSQKFGKVKNVTCLRKTARKEQSKSKRESLRSTSTIVP